MSHALEPRDQVDPADREGAKRTSFAGLEIAYDDRVLEPRPWTELQSWWAAELAVRRDGPILELYAGVGHIGLAAARIAGRPLVQVDVSPVACAFALANARRAGLEHRVRVRCAPVEALATEGSRWAVVTADPPYLPSADVRTHPHDPPLAVDGGPDGLGPARRCLSSIGAACAPGTPVLLQLRGERQAHQLTDQLTEPFELVGVRSVDEDRAVAHFVVRGRA